ncbi:antitoxin VapB family protein [Halovivax limisalsi]|uniref:antitoxin VapB family protein n=1 Tax=Halovivax limisalsi TaxID=1453760 RepID=UPI001FFD889A|nr:antitoxin VapB family protein [Halovivax limisalsi]
MCEPEHRTVTLTEDAYRRLEDRRRPGESLSETVERIAGGRSLLELAGLVTDEEASAMRGEIRNRDRKFRARLDAFVEEIDR